MKTYIVVEELEYEVSARNMDEAIAHVREDGERDKHCFQRVTERYAYAEESYWRRHAK